MKDKNIYYVGTDVRYFGDIFYKYDGKTKQIYFWHQIESRWYLSKLYNTINDFTKNGNITLKQISPQEAVLLIPT